MRFLPHEHRWQRRGKSGRHLALLLAVDVGACLRAACVAFEDVCSATGLTQSRRAAQGLPRGDGAVTTVASFGGIVSWQGSMFDVMKTASWDEVVTALTSNVPQRTNEVVLLFERPLPVVQE